MYKKVVYLILFVIVLISCAKYANNPSAETNRLSTKDYENILMQFKEKFEFLHSIDTLRKIQPYLVEVKNANYFDTINISLFNHIRYDMKVPLTDYDFETFYFDPITTVAFYEYLRESDPIIEIENGIELK